MWPFKKSSNICERKQTISCQKKQTNHIRDNVYINLDLSGKKIKNKNKHIGIIGHLINTKFIDRLSQNRRTSNDLFHPTHPERRNFCVVVLIST